MAGGGSGSWLVPDGVQSTDVEPVVAQRWLQHRRDISSAEGIGPQSQHRASRPTLLTARHCRGVRPDRAVIGGRFEMAHDGGPLRGDEDGGVPARGVDQCHVVRLQTESAALGWFQTDLIPEFSKARPLDGYSLIVSCPKSPRPAKRPILNADPHGMGGVVARLEIQSRLSGRNGSVD